MTNEVKNWRVSYAHDDGRSGVVDVQTEVQEAAAFQYGNGKAGGITVDGYTTGYDLRYNKGDLHMVMLKDYFGAGLVEAVEI